MVADTDGGAGVRRPRTGADFAGASPWLITVWVLLIVLVARMLTGAILGAAGTGSRAMPAALDAGLLVLISAPFVWWVIGRHVAAITAAAGAKSRAIVASTVDGIITIDDAGFIESANAAAERIFGRSVDELVDRPVTMLMPLRYRDAHRMGLLRARREEEPHLLARTVELCGLRPDGTEFPLELSLAKWKAGERTYFTGMVRDITERRRAIDALRASTARYEGLFTQMVNAVGVHEVICDEAGRPCDYRFLAVNPAFERFTGLHARDVVGRRVREVQPDTEQSWIDTLGQVALTGKPVHFAHASERLHGYCEVFAFSPKPGQFATIFGDVADRRRFGAESPAHTLDNAVLGEVRAFRRGTGGK